MKRYMATNIKILKQPFVHHLVIFKDPVTFFMLAISFLIQGQVFTNSDRHCILRKCGKDGHFW